MTGNLTFTMIKPEAFEAGHAGKIIDKILQAGFRLKAVKIIRLSKEQAGAFYDVHRERPFFNNLVEFMTSGPILAAVLEKENAVADFRKLIGSTNPAESDEGTIRKAFGTSLEKNAVHGSDGDENAIIEANFFFPTLERI